MNYLETYRDATIAHPRLALGAALLAVGIIGAVLAGAVFGALRTGAAASEGDYMAERAQ